MEKRSPILVWLFSGLTLGIYYWVWLVKTKNEMNKKGARIPSCWLWIVPIANVFWMVQYAEGVAKVTGMTTGGAFLLRSVLNTIGAAIIQSKFNEVK